MDKKLIFIAVLIAAASGIFSTKRTYTRRRKRIRRVPRYKAYYLKSRAYFTKRRSRSRMRTPFARRSWGRMSFRKNSSYTPNRLMRYGYER